MNVKYELEKRKPWYHEIPVGNIMTPIEGSIGARPHKNNLDRINIISKEIDLKGKTFFDFGCAEGALCFLAESNGAKRVLGYEIDEGRRKRAEYLASLKSSDVRFTNKLPSFQLFDVTICFSASHYFEHPFLEFKNISDLTSAISFFEISVQPESSNEVSWRGPEKMGIIFPSWIMLERIGKYYKEIKILHDPDKDKIGRRIIIKAVK